MIMLVHVQIWIILISLNLGSSEYIYIQLFNLCSVRVASEELFSKLEFFIVLSLAALIA